MRTYHQLTQEQRYQLYAQLRMGKSQKDTADIVGVEKSIQQGEKA